MNLEFLIMMGILGIIALLCLLDRYIKFEKWTTWHCFFLGHNTKLIDSFWSDEKEEYCKRCHLILNDENPVIR